MENLEKDLVQVEKITNLIRDLQSAMELFDRGKKEEALGMIAQAEKAVESLKSSDLARQEKVRENLSLVLEHLDWVEENENRACGQR